MASLTDKEIAEIERAQDEYANLWHRTDRPSCQVSLEVALPRLISDLKAAREALREARQSMSSCGMWEFHASVIQQIDAALPPREVSND